MSIISFAVDSLDALRRRWVGEHQTEPPDGREYVQSFESLTGKPITHSMTIGDIYDEIAKARGVEEITARDHDSPFVVRHGDIFEHVDTPMEEVNQQIDAYLRKSLAHSG